MSRDHSVQKYIHKLGNLWVIILKPVYTGSCSWKSDFNVDLRFVRVGLIGQVTSLYSNLVSA